jgi:hypothetical protein
MIYDVDRLGEFNGDMIYYLIMQKVEPLPRSISHHHIKVIISFINNDQSVYPYIYNKIRQAYKDKREEDQQNFIDAMKQMRRQTQIQYFSIKPNICSLIYKIDCMTKMDENSINLNESDIACRRNWEPTRCSYRSFA